jgi:alpha-1,3-mannosyltransferase
MLTISHRHQLINKRQYIIRGILLVSALLLLLLAFSHAPNTRIHLLNLLSIRALHGAVINNEAAVVREAFFPAGAARLWSLPFSSLQSCDAIDGSPLPPDVSMALAQKSIADIIASGAGIEDKRRAARLLLLPSTDLRKGRDEAVIPPDLTKAMLLARHVLEDTDKLVECSLFQDESLMQDAFRAHSQRKSSDGAEEGRRILIAANLYNAADILPNMITQLVSLALALPHGAISISIYESGSTGSTALWLHFMKLILCLIEIPYHIVTGGGMIRPRDDATEREIERIAFLASIRNEALKPLITSTHLLHWPGSKISPGLGSMVIFLNDVLFCHQSLTRLVMLNQDLACGIDLSNESPFKPSDGRLLWLYDSWVARDRTGNMINSSFPNMDDPVSTTRAKVGLPFPAYCCFNGMASIALAPFLDHQIRFRGYLDEECRASECSMLCDDLHRIGHHKIAIDPTVRVVYRSSHINLAFKHQKSFDPQMEIGHSTWERLKASGPIHSADRVINTSRVLCCNKNLDSDRIVWTDCEPWNPMAINYTGVDFKRQGDQRTRSKREG